MDGLLVDKELYSIKYGTRMMCGHHYYTMLFRKSNDIDERRRIDEELMEKFSDNGEAQIESQTCIECGENLGTRGYDDTEGFNQFGAIKKSREIWNEETISTCITRSRCKDSNY